MRGESLVKRGTTTPAQSQGEAVGETQGGYEGRESEVGIAPALGSTQPTKGRGRGRGVTTQDTQRQTEVLMSKSTLPLDNRCWKLIKDVKED